MLGQESGGYLPGNNVIDLVYVCRVGGSIPVVWTYFAEFQPANRRGGALSFLATFWMVSSGIVQ